jgi:hypothetical protein
MAAFAAMTECGKRAEACFFDGAVHVPARAGMAECVVRARAPSDVMPAQAGIRASGSFALQLVWADPGLRRNNDGCSPGGATPRPAAKGALARARSRR